MLDKNNIGTLRQFYLYFSESKTTSTLYEYTFRDLNVFFEDFCGCKHATRVNFVTKIQIVKCMYLGITAYDLFYFKKNQFLKSYCSTMFNYQVYF